jgi:hypothetical protein
MLNRTVLATALALATLLCLAVSAPAWAVTEGKYWCIGEYAATIGTDPPYVGQIYPNPNGGGLSKFFVTIFPYSRLTAEGRQHFAAAIEGTGFVPDSETYVAKFEKGASIDALHELAFSHLSYTDKEGDAPHIYRSRFGGVFWMGLDDGFTVFTHTIDLRDLIIRGRCAMVGPPS